MCYLRFWTCLLLGTWINSKLFVSNEHPGSLATTQKGFNLLQGFLVWHGKTSLIYGLQIVRDQISYSNHHAIWHNVTQNVPVNVYEQNVYTLNCSWHFSPAIAACSILHPVFGCWSNPQMRKSKEVEWSRIKRMQLLWLFCNCLCGIWEVARLNQLMFPEVGFNMSFGLFDCLASVQAKTCVYFDVTSTQREEKRWKSIAQAHLLQIQPAALKCKDLQFTYCISSYRMPPCPLHRPLQILRGTP